MMLKSLAVQEYNNPLTRSEAVFNYTATSRRSRGFRVGLFIYFCELRPRASRLFFTSARKQDLDRPPAHINTVYIYIALQNLPL